MFSNSLEVVNATTVEKITNTVDSIMILRRTLEILFHVINKFNMTNCTREVSTDYDTIQSLIERGFVQLR